MITIDINGESRRLETGNHEPWLLQKIDGRLREGIAVCVVVEIERPGVHMRLATCDCRNGGGWRPPNKLEAEILALWERYELSCRGFSAKHLIAFLRALAS